MIKRIIENKKRLEKTGKNKKKKDGIHRLDDWYAISCLYGIKLVLYHTKLPTSMAPSDDLVDLSTLVDGRD